MASSPEGRLDRNPTFTDPASLRGHRRPVGLAGNIIETGTVPYRLAHACAVEMRHVVAGISGRHVDVMRGELATILYEATPSDPQYLFEDSIHTINQEPDGIAVTFEHAAADRFDLVIGADGLHSIVRASLLRPKTSSADFSVSVMAYTIGLPQAD